MALSCMRSKRKGRMLERDPEAREEEDGPGREDGDVSHNIEVFKKEYGTPQRNTWGLSTR